MEKALNGLRILDFSWVLAGPYATRLLADYGAEVIKVQPLLPEADDRFSQGYYETWNRNKLGITLNLERAEGRKIARRLIAQSDAVVENFSPRVMDNWGLDYPALRNIRPDIIFLRMSAMGHSGPRQNFSGFGPTVQALSGFTSLAGYPGEAPLGVGFSVSDHVSGLYGAVALLGALEYRNNTGEGQYIDLSQTEAMTSLLADNILKYTQNCMMTLDNRPAPEGIYPCRGVDRWAAITVFSQAEWEKFKNALGQPDWAERPEFSTVSARIQNKELLDNHIHCWTVLRTPEEIINILQEHGIAAGIVQNTTDLATDPQLSFRRAESPMEKHKPAPARGENNDYVYRNLLGMSQGEMERLKQDKVI